MKTYFEPEIEICDFAVEDILTVSPVSSDINSAVEIGGGIEDAGDADL